MKKLLSILFIPLFFACGSLFVDPSETKAFKKNFLVSEGMTKQEVIEIMGSPVASEFSEGVEEFHFCATGYNSDDFVAIADNLIDHCSKDSDAGLSLDSLPELIEKLEFKMKSTAIDLDFEKAAILRDRIKKLRHRLIGN